MDCRRPDLGNVSFDAESGLHVGLWLDRGLSAQPDDMGKAREPLQRATDRLFNELDRANRKPQGYPSHLDRVRADAKSLEVVGQARLGEAKVLGRMIVGLGAKNALEFGIHLDHTWGVPVIPGSSLKGLAAATADKLVREDSWRKPAKDKSKGNDQSREATQFEWLFGTTENRGAVQFWDAWWVPDSKKDTEKVPIHRDVMTVHHADYYQGKSDGKGGIAPPSDMDDPNPIGFLSVSGTYLVVVEGDPEWTGAAMALLKKGLIDLGIGAKTNAGYGRLKLDYAGGEASPEAPSAASAAGSKPQTGPSVPKGPTAQELAEKAEAGLAKFKAEVTKANESTRPSAIKANWAAVGALQGPAAVWLVETVYGVDAAFAEKNFAKKDWYMLVRKAYRTANS